MMWHDRGSEATATQTKAHGWRGEPILGLGVYLSSTPWRLGPAWAALSGALAAQAPLRSGEDLIRLGGSLLLADAVWGVLWRQPVEKEGVAPIRERGPILPYTAAHSPWIEVLSGLGDEAAQSGGTGWHGILAALGFAAVLSILLGPNAVVLSLLTVIASICIRLMVRRGWKPAFILALLCTGLPWALGASLGWVGDAESLGRSGAGLALGAAFTVLTWSIYSVGSGGSRGLAGPIWCAQCALLATLIVTRELLGTAIVFSLLVVPSLWISRRTCLPQEVAGDLRASDLWWLTSMLAAALAVRF